MKKYVIILSGILSAVVVLLMVCYVLRDNAELKIETGDMKSISVYYFDKDHKDAVPIDINDFAEYYNSISNVSPTDGGGSTPDSLIKIELYSGTIIEIYDDLHYKYPLKICINEHGEETKYYAKKQKQIEEILKGKYK